ncbi:MAG: caspase family protein [Bacteroidales bacterium]|nr:caspase family protein [Bacteroidales bacterium]
MIRTHVLLHLVALACLGVVPVVVIAGDPVPVGVRPATGVISTQTVPPASATPAHRGVLLRDGPGIGTSAEATYREKWAVVIGVNYTAEDRDPAWGAWSLPLANAENDATNVREMLVKYYGYKPECVRFLTGRAAKNPPPPTADHGAARGATAAEIDNALGAGFLCGDAVQEEDSVLVFFSGHGFLRYDLTRTKSSVYLAPADMRMQANGTPNFDLAAIRMDEVVGKLRDHCRAKHKLLILDCCFSGSVWIVSDERPGIMPPEELFRQRRHHGWARSPAGSMAPRRNPSASRARIDGHSSAWDRLPAAFFRQ